MTTEADLEIDETNEDEDGDLSSESPDGERYDRYHPSKQRAKQEKKAADKSSHDKDKNNNSHEAADNLKSKLKDKINTKLQENGSLPAAIAGKALNVGLPKVQKYVKAANKVRRGDYSGAAIDAGKQLALDAAKKGVVSFFSSPPGMITLAAIIILLILLFIIFLLITIISGGAHQKNKQNQNKTITISKTGPTNAKVNDILEYKISLNASHPVSDIVVVDHYPEGTVFVSSSWKGETINKTNRTITWHAKDNVQSAGGSFNASNLSLTLRLRATRDNTTLINWAEANATFVSTNETLTITKDGPAKASNNQEITYTISVKETQNVSDIVVVDHMPADTRFVSSSWGKHQINNAANTITWHAKDNIGQNGSLNNFTIKLTLRATRDNTNLVNWAEANSVVSAGGPISTTYVPASNNNCQGKYTISSLKNFGDPQCNFTKPKLAELIKSADPQHLHEWYDIIIKNESTYNPNAFNGNSTSGQGAFGLYQMNPRGRGNGKFDAGDVNWEMQTENAIQYNKTVLIPMGCIFWYWSTARNAGFAKGPC